MKVEGSKSKVEASVEGYACPSHTNAVRMSVERSRNYCEQSKEFATAGEYVSTNLFASAAEIIIFRVWLSLGCSQLHSRFI